MKKLWKGIAISGIWIAWTISLWSPAFAGDDSWVLSGFGAGIVTIVIAIVGENREKIIE